MALLQDFAREAAMITDRDLRRKLGNPKTIGYLIDNLRLSFMARLLAHNMTLIACFGLAEGRTCSYRWFHRNRRI
jgi:hypothetical protein